MAFHFEPGAAISRVVYREPVRFEPEGHKLHNFFFVFKEWQDHQKPVTPSVTLTATGEVRTISTLSWEPNQERLAFEVNAT